VRIVNDPISGRLAKWLLRNTATGCRVRLNFRSRSDGSELGPVRASWSATPDPIQYIFAEESGTVTVTPFWDPEKEPGRFTYDVSPGSDGEGVAVAIKHDGDDEVYAFGPELYHPMPQPLKAPSLRLPAPFLRHHRSPGVPAVRRTGVDGSRRHSDDDALRPLRPEARRGAAARKAARRGPKSGPKHRRGSVVGGGRQCLAVARCRRLLPVPHDLIIRRSEVRVLPGPCAGTGLPGWPHLPENGPPEIIQHAGGLPAVLRVAARPCRRSPPRRVRRSTPRFRQSG
jgi:hypothetical protein